MDSAENAGAEVLAETKAIRELQDQRLADQAKINKDVQTKQDAVGDDIELLGKKIEELTANGEAGAQVEEQQAKNAADIASLQDRLEKTSAEAEKTNAGLSEQMGSLVQSTADIMGKVETCAKQEVVSKLSARVEGGFDALILRLESEKWMRENVDKIADNVANSFLRLLDDSSQKLAARVDKLEHRMSAG